MTALQNHNRQQSQVNEQGFILIVTMVILVVLTILSIGALSSSTFEVQIAANDRQSRVVFNLADSGAYVAGKLIGDTLKSDSDPPSNPLDSDLEYTNFFITGDPVEVVNNQVTIPGGLRDVFYARAMGFAAPRSDGKYDFKLNDPNGQGAVYGRITSRKSESLKGGSTVFASGSGGAGAGSLGSTAIVMDIDVDAYSARNSRSNLEVRYRNILGAVE